MKNVHVAADEFEVKKDAVNEGVTASMVGGVRERGVRVKARSCTGGVQRRGTSYARFAGLRAALGDQGLVFVSFEIHIHTMRYQLH